MQLQVMNSVYSILSFIYSEVLAYYLRIYSSILSPILIGYEPGEGHFSFLANYTSNITITCWSNYSCLRTKLIAQILLQQTKTWYQTLIYDKVPSLIDLYQHDRRPFPVH